MKKFEAYVRDLEARANAALHDRLTEEARSELPAILNGAVATALKRGSSLASRRRSGAFFTGPELRDRLVELAGWHLDSPNVVWDPACGAGDLLIGATARFLARGTLTETVRRWSKQLGGRDVHPFFVRAARARLVLAAYDGGARNQRNRSLDITKCFPKVVHGNALQDGGIPDRTSVIMLNPPFITMPAPKGCRWAGGGVSAAAVFLEMSIKQAIAGTRIVAILPDVLRSGSRYFKWRKLVAEHASIEHLETWGPFHPNVDVDVFLIHLRVGRQRSAAAVDAIDQPWFQSGPVPHLSLGDLCSVTVGAVVPHRHMETGPARPFLYARVARTSSLTTDRLPSRRFAGTVHEPPFVAVRRTSSPADLRRVVATIVSGSQPVAVENHLLVVKPSDGSLETCAWIHTVVSSQATATWLNRRLRCRHLTTEAVRAIPLEGGRPSGLPRNDVSRRDNDG